MPAPGIVIPAGELAGLLMGHLKGHGHVRPTGILVDSEDDGLLSCGIAAAAGVPEDFRHALVSLFPELDSHGNRNLTGCGNSAGAGRVRATEKAKSPGRRRGPGLSCELLHATCSLGAGWVPVVMKTTKQRIGQGSEMVKM